MNSHLNVFKTYTKANTTYQLENDLTRSFAICMQEDPLFFHEILKNVLAHEDRFELLSGQSEAENDVFIDIQVNTKILPSCEKIIAVSLTDGEMSEEHFWSQCNETEYDPICDIIIKLNETLIVIEAKRNRTDCTSQLYNQVYNILRNSDSQNSMREVVTPVDLNWKKLMEIASSVLSFEKMAGNINRFTSDFVNLVKGHNPHWVPEVPIAALAAQDKSMIMRRVESAISVLEERWLRPKLNRTDRVGLSFSKPWAQEVLLRVDSETGDLVISIYPGNTKAQGSFIFSKDPKISQYISIAGKDYKADKMYHIKLTSFQRFFTGLWFYDKHLKKEGLYSRENFHLYAGRKYRSSGHWDKLEFLFDEYFHEEFKWREKISWASKVTDSGKTQFDLSFGYEIAVIVPFADLKAIDKDQYSVDGLTNLIESCYLAFENDLIIHHPAQVEVEAPPAL